MSQPPPGTPSRRASRKRAANLETANDISHPDQIAACADTHRIGRREVAVVAVHRQNPSPTAT